MHEIMKKHFLLRISKNGQGSIRGSGTTLINPHRLLLESNESRFLSLRGGLSEKLRNGRARLAAIRRRLRCCVANGYTVRRREARAPTDGSDVHVGKFLARLRTHHASNLSTGRRRATKLASQVGLMIQVSRA